MSKNSHKHEMLIKELDRVDKGIQTIFIHRFQMYQIAYIPFISILALVVYKSKIFSNSSNIEPVYGVYFIFLLIPIYVLAIVDYKFVLSYTKLILIRLNIFKEIFINNDKDTLSNVLNVNFPYDDYYLGSRAANRVYKFFVFLIYSGICLASILCFKNDINKAIRVGVILFLFTLLFAVYYRIWLEPKKRNIQNKINEIVSNLNQYKNPNRMGIDYESVEKNNC